MQNPIATFAFLLIVLITTALTFFAARRTRSSDSFYNAGGEIGGVQNGLAISAEFTSAASLLGVVALLYGFGADIIVFLVSSVAGFAFVLFVMAGRYRELGKFTLADVIASRFPGKSLRVFSAVSSLIVVIFYLIAQMVGAGTLLKLLFGISYETSLVIVGALVFLYVTFGGMLATTWVQILKTCLFVGGISLICFLILSRTGFSLTELATIVVDKHSAGQAFMEPGLWLDGPVSTISLAAAMLFGVGGLPHILIRFCTVKDPIAAQKSMFVATLVIAFVATSYLILGFGAVAFVLDNPVYVSESGQLRGGGNMAFIHLSHALGGELLLGITCAAVYATILAVVAGLVIAAVSAVAHDLYVTAIKDGNVDDQSALRVSRLASATIAAIAVALGLAFENQNIGYMVSLAFAVAASANFPVLLLVLHWPGFTSRGALVGGYTGLAMSVLLIILGPTVWVELLGNDQAAFPYKEPALFSMLLAFLACWLVSILDRRGASLRPSSTANTAVVAPTEGRD